MRKIDGAKLIELRKRKDITQKQLSEMISVSPKAMRKAERDEDLKWDAEIDRIAKALGVEPSEFCVMDYRKTIGLTIYNNKGGCSKTTTVVNLAYSLSILGKRVLIIDTDGQAHTSILFKVREANQSRKYTLPGAIVDFITYRYSKEKFRSSGEHEFNIYNYIKKTDYPEIDIISGHEMTYGLKESDWGLINPIMVFTRMLSPIVESGAYDFIIFDTNPSLDIMKMNVLSMTDYVIIPVTITPLGIDSLNLVLDLLNPMMDEFENLSILGILRTQYSRLFAESRKLNNLLGKEYSKQLFDVVIRTDQACARSQSYDIRKPAIEYDKNSKAGIDYMEFAKEVLNRVEN